jgi:DNA-directed RNA polymerase subunit beta'
VKTEIMNEMVDGYEKENDIFYQIDSGARGNWGQITQLSGMKGLVASPSGRTIELPIKSNLKEGFTILEYFIATHGGRKGKSDTALKTAEAGYLTRRLVDSVQDIVVREKDCKTTKYKRITRENSMELGLPFEDRLFGRVIGEDVKIKGKVILKKGDVINEEKIEIIREKQITEIQVRSVMFCQTTGGVCQKCYGYDLGHNAVAEMGTPVGIIAAQSIGEPGTQLTMRTFHMGGIATEEASITQGLTRVEELFEARTPNNAGIISEIRGTVNIKKGKNDTKIIVSAEKAEDDIHHLSVDFESVVQKGDQVKEKQIIARAIEGRGTIKARCAGKIKEVSIDQIVIHQSQAAEKTYTISPRITLKIKQGEKVQKGQALTAGHLDLRQLMELTDVETVQGYILWGVQSIYASQGQDINEKHIEIIARQMVSKVRVLEPGDSEWLPGEIKDFVVFEKKNAELVKKKKRIAKAERLLLGLTRVSLWTDSWLSAASFQETTRVLVEAATTKRVDTLDGLKENVIIGRLIPAGTGFATEK